MFQKLTENDKNQKWGSNTGIGQGTELRNRRK